MIGFAHNIIDIILVMVVVFSVLKAYKDGFFTASINLIGNVAGVILGFALSKKISVVIFENYFRENIAQNTFEYLKTTSNAIDTKEMILNAVDWLPEKLLADLIEKGNQLAQEITAPTIDTAYGIVDALIAPIFTMLIGVGIFILIVILSKVITAVLAKAFRAINHIPVIGLVNRLAGMAVGLAVGGINIVVISFFLCIIAIATQNSIELMNLDVLSASRILAFTRGINPFL